MERDSQFEFIGFMAVLFGATALVYLIQTLFGDVRVLEAMRNLNPWMAENAKPISWVLCAAVFFGAMAIPPVFMAKEARDGVCRLSVIGLVVILTCVVASFGYLFGVL